MPRIKWSPRALDDVVRLHGFLAEKSPEAARRAVQAIQEGTRLLTTHPEIGRVVDELPSELREWIIEFGQGGYIARYSYDGKQVVILAVRHGREAGY